MDDDEEDDKVDINSLSRGELITRLQRLGLKMTGKKITLRVRLKEALQPDDEDEDGDNSGSDSSREETVMPRVYRWKTQGGPHCHISTKTVVEKTSCEFFRISGHK